MKIRICTAAILVLISNLIFSACSAGNNQASATGKTIRVLVVESFLTDIVQNVAGDRLKVDTLIPLGMDPHAYQPTPQDVVRIAESQVIIINGAHFEEWLGKTLENAGGDRLVIEASMGLISREPTSAELLDPDHACDPHFWLNPLKVIDYVKNIRDGLSQVDPEGETVYSRNADVYIARLKELDQWITTQVDQIAEKDRQLVTNHESFGYFADRYGFRITGTIIPSTSSDASPTAQQMVALIDQIKLSEAKAIFIETGANPQLAEQISQETGVKVTTDLYTHSITAPDGDAPGYIEMMKHNVNLIVAALK